MYSRKRVRPQTVQVFQRQSQKDKEDIKNGNQEYSNLKQSQKKKVAADSHQDPRLSNVHPKKTPLNPEQAQQELKRCHKGKQTLLDRLETLEAQKRKQKPQKMISKLKNKNPAQDQNEVPNGLKPRNRGQFKKQESLKEDEEKQKLLRKNSIKRQIFYSNFSRVHQDLSLRQQTLFLAILVLDDLIAIKNKEREQITHLQALSCLFMAAKFEEIYAPRFTKLSQKFGVSMSLNDYMVIELKILMKLNFTLNARRGPFFHLMEFPCLVEAQESSNQRKSFVNFMLQIAAYEERICQRYTWPHILEAITLFLKEEVDWTKYEASPVQFCYKSLKTTKNWMNYRNPIFYKYSKAQHHYCSTLEPPKASI